MTAEITKAAASDVAVQHMSADAARTLTDKIRQTLQTGHSLIAEAWRGGAWAALGYPTWDAYCAGEFAEARMVRLARDQRQEIVQQMHAEGMSSRAIASGLGVDQKTVVNDVKAKTAGEESSSPAPVKGLDGKTYKPKGSAAAKSPGPAKKLTPKQAEKLAEAEAKRAERKKTSDLTWLQDIVDAADYLGSYLLNGVADDFDREVEDDDPLEAAYLLREYPDDVLAMVTKIREGVAEAEKKAEAALVAVKRAVERQG